MDAQTKQDVLDKWQQHFPDIELPVAGFFADEIADPAFAHADDPDKGGSSCFFTGLNWVRKGHTRAFNASNLGCFGATDAFGFVKPEVADDLTKRLVDEGQHENTAQEVVDLLAANRPMPARGTYLVFKRWDLLSDGDQPQVVFMFAKTDAMAGLHALANLDATTPDGVVAPFGPGCNSIIAAPFRELASAEPRAVLGGLDPAIRRHLGSDLLVLSAPWPKFQRMVDGMDDAFRVTGCLGS